MFDVEEDVSGPTDQQLKTISANVERALHLSKILIPEAEAVLTELNEEFKRIVEKDIPNAMTDANTATFTYKNNIDEYNVVLTEDVVATITEANKAAAHAWLTKNGHGDLIKREVTLKFGRGEEKIVKKFLADLARRKIPLIPIIKEAVHNGTLRAFVREQRRESDNPDEAVPMDLFGIFKLRYAEFIKPKKKKII